MKFIAVISVVASILLSGCDSVNSFGEVTYDPSTNKPVARVGWGNPPPAPALELPKKNSGFSKL